MSRLLRRFGVRALAIGGLVVGLTGGLSLALHRQTLARTTAHQHSVSTDADEVHEIRLVQASASRATASQAAADASAAAADQARAAEAARVQAANRSRDRLAASPSPSPTSAPAPAAAPAPKPVIPASCSSYHGNQAIGCSLLSKFGFGLNQMSCLVSLWNRESGWQVSSANSSGAYGIPQALPGNKMASAGADWRTNPATQISWGLGYIKGRWGTPCGAWSHSQATGWY